MRLEAASVAAAVRQRRRGRCACPERPAPNRGMRSVHIPIGTDPPATRRSGYPCPACITTTRNGRLSSTDATRVVSGSDVHANQTLRSRTPRWHGACMPWPAISGQGRPRRRHAHMPRARLCRTNSVTVFSHREKELAPLDTALGHYRRSSCPGSGSPSVASSSAGATAAPSISPCPRPGHSR